MTTWSCHIPKSKHCDWEALVTTAGFDGSYLANLSWPQSPYQGAGKDAYSVSAKMSNKRPSKPVQHRNYDGLF